MRKLVLISLIAASAMTASAQEALWSGTNVKSPVVNADNTVTFNILAPQAKAVTVTGDFLPQRKVNTPMGEMDAPGVAQLTKNDKGVWSYTTEKLLPELYSYSLNIDGQQALDLANVYVNRDVASLTNIFIISEKAGDKGDLYSVREVPHGDVAKVWYDSPTLGMQRRMTIYTPAGYDKGKDYPVLYLLHGAGGDEDAWTTLGRTAQIMDNLIASGKAKPMVVVMPNGNMTQQASPGASSAGMFQPSMAMSISPRENAKASMDESFMDIVKYIESHYKVKADKQHRAICGLSMGGGHSFAVSKRYPDTFNYIGLFSAGLHIGTSGDRNTPFYDMLKKNQQVQGELQKLFQGKPALYWIAIGKTDFLYQQNSDLRRYLDEKGYAYKYRETEGGHIWRNWRIYLTEFAQMIF